MSYTSKLLGLFRKFSLFFLTFTGFNYLWNYKMLSSLVALICLIEHINGLSLNFSNETLAKVRGKRNTFVCPGDGKWPDETDCGK